MDQFKHKYVHMKTKYVELKSKQNLQIKDRTPWNDETFNRFLQNYRVVNNKEILCNETHDLSKKGQKSLANGSFSLIHRVCFEEKSYILKINLIQTPKNSRTQNTTSKVKVLEDIELSYMTEEAYNKEMSILKSLNSINNTNLQISPMLYFSQIYDIAPFKKLTNTQQIIDSSKIESDKVAITVIEEIKGIELGHEYKINEINNSFEPKVFHEIFMKLLLLHRANIIHNDFKDNNIMFTSSNDEKKKITLIDFGESIPLTEEASSDHTRLLNLPLNIDHLYLIISYTFYLEVKQRFCCDTGISTIKDIFNSYKNTGILFKNEEIYKMLIIWFEQYYWVLYISLLFLKKINNIYPSVKDIYDKMRDCYEIIWQGYENIRERYSTGELERLEQKHDVIYRESSNKIKNDVPIFKNIIEANCTNTVENYLKEYWKIKN